MQVVERQAAIPLITGHGRVRIHLRAAGVIDVACKSINHRAKKSDTFSRAPGCRYHICCLLYCWSDKRVSPRNMSSALLGCRYHWRSLQFLWEQFITWILHHLRWYSLPARWDKNDKPRNVMSHWYRSIPLTTCVCSPALLTCHWRRDSAIAAEECKTAVNALTAVKQAQGMDGMEGRGFVLNLQYINLLVQLHQQIWLASAEVARRATFALNLCRASAVTIKPYPAKRLC